jgi:hypothetical protein
LMVGMEVIFLVHIACPFSCYNRYQVPSFDSCLLDQRIWNAEEENVSFPLQHVYSPRVLPWGLGVLPFLGFASTTFFFGDFRSDLSPLGKIFGTKTGMCYRSPSHFHSLF